VRRLKAALRSGPKTDRLPIAGTDTFPVRASRAPPDSLTPFVGDTRRSELVLGSSSVLCEFQFAEELDVISKRSDFAGVCVDSKAFQSALGCPMNLNRVVIEFPALHRSKLVIEAVGRPQFAGRHAQAVCDFVPKFQDQSLGQIVRREKPAVDAVQRQILTVSEAFKFAPLGDEVPCQNTTNNSENNHSDWDESRIHPSLSRTRSGTSAQQANVVEALEHGDNNRGASKELPDSTADSSELAADFVLP